MTSPPITFAPTLMLIARLGLATAAAVFAAGCSGSTDVPPSIVGTYLLHTAAGQPAPALIHTAVDTSHAPIDIYLVSDTLQILDGGRYTQRGHLEARVASQLVSTSRWSDHGVVTVDGNALHFASNFLQNVAFDGTVGAGRMLSVTQNLATEGTPDLYLFTPAP